MTARSVSSYFAGNPDIPCLAELDCRNEADVCALIDQDGNENRGKTMVGGLGLYAHSSVLCCTTVQVGQTCILELEAGDRVQVSLQTSGSYVLYFTLYRCTR